MNPAFSRQQSYDSLERHIRRARKLHDITHDPLLASATHRLTIALGRAADPTVETIQLDEAEWLAWTLVARMEDARLTLFGD